MLCAAILAAPFQGGSGGFQGGRGGFGGGGAASGNSVEGQVTQHILTPGDKADWPLDVKEGEVIVFRISSTNFDPAIEVVDEAGKSLGKNDDIEPGVQNAQLLVRFPKAGKYKALVSNYRSNAGGMYEYSIKRFRAMDLKLGERTKVPALSSDRQPLFGCVQLKKGQIAQLIPETTGSNVYFEPNGSDSGYSNSITGFAGTPVIEANVDGDYYMELRQDWNREANFTMRVAPVRTIEVGAKTSSELIANAFEIWEFARKPNDLLNLEAIGASGLRLWIDDRGLESGAGDASKRQFELINENKRKTRQTYHSEGEGKLRAFVLSRSTTKYEFSCTKAAIEGKTGGDFDGSISFGGAAAYAFRFERGDVVEFKSSSSEFDSEFRVIGPNRVIAIQDDTGEGVDAMQTLSLTESGTYFVNVSAVGNGGRGKFHLSAKRLPPMRLKLNETKSHSPKTLYDAVWDIEIPALGAAVLRMKGDVSQGNWSMTDPDGSAPNINEIRLSDTERLFVIVKPKAGVYRLWMQGMKVGGNYQLSLSEFK